MGQRVKQFALGISDRVLCENVIGIWSNFGLGRSVKQEFVELSMIDRCMVLLNLKVFYLISSSPLC